MLTFNTLSYHNGTKILVTGSDSLEPKESFTINSDTLFFLDLLEPDQLHDMEVSKDHAYKIRQGFHQNYTKSSQTLGPWLTAPSY